MQIRKRIKTVKPASDNEFEKSLEQELLSYSLELAQIINRGIKFSDNFNAEILTVADTGAADTQFTIAHPLKRAPAGYLVIKINKAGVVYDSGAAWTDTDMYLKCSAANCAVTVLVF